jgi:5S rRNA maturation endonuclease (ribonuclease M5)
MSNAYTIANSSGKFKRSGEWFNLCCPLHEDKKPSLGIRDGEDGSVIFKCLAGCESKELAEFYKAKGFIVHKEKEQPIPQQAKKEICRYQYINEHGELLFEKIRFEPKGFLIVNPSGTGDGGHKGALYNAQSLIGIEGKTVYITEGEKDVDSLISLGFIAVTSGGASNWPEKNNHLFAGVHVRILPDNDNPGREYAKKVRESLESVAASIKVMYVPDKYKDVSDWIGDGAEAENIEELFNTHKFKTISFENLLKLDMKIDWIVQDYLEANGLCQIFGAPGSGKSFFALDMAYCIASGTEFFGKKVKKSNVLFIAGEGFTGLKKRAKALHDKYSSEVGDIAFSMQAAELLNENSCIDVADRIKNNAGGFGAVFIDTLNRNMGGGDESSTKDMTLFISNVDKYIRSLGCAVYIVHHSGLNDADRGRGSSALYGALSTEIKISKIKDGTALTALCTKQKESESGWKQEFDLLPVVIGSDDVTGEAIYSCVLKQLDQSKDKGLKAREQAVFDGLREACVMDGRDITIHEVPIVIINDDTWREYAYKRLSGQNKRREFREAKESLLKSELVLEVNGMFYTLEKL